jgi:hypothetical protein
MKSSRIAPVSLMLAALAPAVPAVAGAAQTEKPPQAQSHKASSNAHAASKQPDKTHKQSHKSTKPPAQTPKK